MQTALDYAVNKMKLSIPKEILNLVFLEKTNRFSTYRSARSIDDQIREKVIEGFVMVDINNLGANEMDIPVKSSWCQVVDSNNLIVRIPKAYTQNRSITEVISATYLPQSGYLMPYGTIQAVSEVPLAQNKLLNNVRNPTIAGTVGTTIIGDNAIKVTGAGTTSNNLFLTVMVEYDETISSLPKTAYSIFGQLCALACKAYIWVNRIVIMDKAEIEGGYQLNRLTSIIEGYEDAAEQYEEFLNEKWKKISFKADPVRQSKYISMITRVGL